MKVSLMALAMVGFSGYVLSANQAVNVSYMLYANSTVTTGLCTAEKLNGGVSKNGANFKIDGLKCDTLPNIAKSVNSTDLVSVGSVVINNGALTLDLLDIQQNVQINNDGSSKIDYIFTVQQPVPAINAPVVDSPSSVSNDCKDDLKSPLLPCANNPKIKMIDLNPTGETYLPGCAGLNDVNRTKCFLKNSMKDETYALRFKFNEIIKTDANGNYDIRILSVTRDFLDEDQYRRFDMSISENPGQFTGLAKECIKKGAEEGTDMGIYGRQVITGRPNNVPLSENQCPLTPGKQYYINVKASEAGCMDPATKTFPTRQGCIMLLRMSVVQN